MKSISKLKIGGGLNVESELQLKLLSVSQKAISTLAAHCLTRLNSQRAELNELLNNAERADKSNIYKQLELLNLIVSVLKNPSTQKLPALILYLFSLLDTDQNVTVPELCSAKYEKRCDALRNAKIELKMTQLQIALALGISEHTYSNYERGKTSIPIDVLYRLYSIFSERNMQFNFTSFRTVEDSTPINERQKKVIN